MRTTPAAAERDGQHDFDFLAGQWKIHIKRRPATGTAWSELDGTAFYRVVLDGRANVDQFEADGASGHIEGLTLRTYDPVTHEWSLYSANGREGILGLPQVGEFRGGRGEFYAQDRVDGRITLVRYEWSRPSANSAHFEQALSSDGGRTWSANWISDMARTSGPAHLDADAPAPPVVDSATTAKASTGGQHDFDPLIGRWRYHLRRRLRPLTGSNDWVDLTGTGVCYPLWGGRAQLDTFQVEGSGARIEGLTLRMYDPRSREWRLYWANSRDGIVAVPQVGRFTDGHGDFYATDTLDDEGILVRFDWSAMHSLAPHFEQSFSRDGGASWEVNWITDQTRETASSGSR